MDMDIDWHKPRTPIPVSEDGESSGDDASCTTQEDHPYDEWRLKDPFEYCQIPREEFYHKTELCNQMGVLEWRIRQLSFPADLVGEDEEKVLLYVETRAKLVEDTTHSMKKWRAAMNDLKVQRPVFGKGFNEYYLEYYENTEMALLRERVVLAKNRKGLESGILSKSDNVIGEAYLACIQDDLWRPSVRKDNIRCGARLLRAYNPPNNSDQELIWCPISRKSYAVDCLIATHFVPYRTGEFNTAYLFGMGPKRGYSALWGTGNGLLLYKDLSVALEDCELVIVPDGESTEELKVVVLEKSLLDKRFGPYREMFFRDIDNRQLQFQTEARPDRRFLFLHCLLSLFRRKRLNAESWEADFRNVGMSRQWGPLGQWLRRSMIRALAYEIGDVSKLEDCIEADFFADFADQLSGEEEARIAMEIRHALEGEAYDLTNGGEGDGFDRVFICECWLG